MIMKIQYKISTLLTMKSRVNKLRKGYDSSKDKLDEILKSLRKDERTHQRVANYCYDTINHQLLDFFNISSKSTYHELYIYRQLQKIMCLPRYISFDDYVNELNYTLHGIDFKENVPSYLFKIMKSVRFFSEELPKYNDIYSQLHSLKIELNRFDELYKDRKNIFSIDSDIYDSFNKIFSMEYPFQNIIDYEIKRNPNKYYEFVRELERKE